MDRYRDELSPPQVLAALNLMWMLADKPSNALTLYIHRTGPEFTQNEETCASYLQNRPSNTQLSAEQVAIALMYTTISQTPRHNPSVLVAALRRLLPAGFRWQDVVSYFDHDSIRVTSAQFLRLYHALLPIARANSDFNIQLLWGGDWEHPETQLSFICAFASLNPDQLDATTIPGFTSTLALKDYAQSPETVQEVAAYAVRHPLASLAALSTVFSVALHSNHASQSTEAKRLFQVVVVPNLAVFVASAFNVPKPWPAMAEDVLRDLFRDFLKNKKPEADFVMDSLWRRDKEWVKQRLIEYHANQAMCLPIIFDFAVQHNWLQELAGLLNGFGLDLVAFAHGKGYLNLHDWARRNRERGPELVRNMIQFLAIKAELESASQRNAGDPKATTSLSVKTVSAMLQILEELLPPNPVPELIVVQRLCITAYPRLINYGEGFDDIIDANGRNGNALSATANNRMEEHYKKMYSGELQVRDVVQILEQYKRSRDPVEQDVFACMIHGLFDEYNHYVDYPLEALATTAVLFGGTISHKLINDLPLQIGLGMILEAVRDHRPDESMYKFGLQALMQLFGRLHEWPGFCKQLLQIPGLEGTEARRRAEESVREHEGEAAAHSVNGGLMPHPSMNTANVVPERLVNGGPLEDGLSSEQHPPPFTSVNVDPPRPGANFEDPTVDAQGKIQFVLNNLTDTTLNSMMKELREMLEAKHQQWFASHLVEERAKMQPNYHNVYLELVERFEDDLLFDEVLRETFISVQRMLNAEVTLQSSIERTHLKNLGGWLGLLTLARNMPIKHNNIAFKQLLIEAHDTQRLIVVIPFVCKVLSQGATSQVFRPPNPWLMDIIYLLIELYHNAELKLNLKFEIEVLCKGLNLDHKSIKPSGEIMNRAPVEEVGDIVGQETLDAFDNMNLNGMAGISSSHSIHASLPPIPDLGPNLSIPQTEVIPREKLHDLVRQALTRALQEIIQPVVDRSVTIAAISTKEMVHKDFATEPDESRVRNAAISMVKSTAGSLALVTSKEPLRANFTNTLRNLASELPNGLPEGIIMLCVNSNLDLASSVIEKSAEERAVPEIEELIAEDIEVRRRHRLTRGTDPFLDPTLSRWALTIPHPYKLNAQGGGLNAEQMAIYDDFARQPRVPAPTSTPSHVPTASDARSLTNEILGDQYHPVPSIPTPAETPSVPHLGAQLPHYAQGHGAATNGRQVGLNQMDLRTFVERISKLLEQLITTATSAPEDHFGDLPRPHDLLDIIDALVQLVIKTQQASEDFASYAATEVSRLIFLHAEENNSLLLESLVHVLETLRKIAGPTASQQVRSLFHQQPGHVFLHLPLLAALLGTDLLDWASIDEAMAKALQIRKENSVKFLEQLMDLALLNETPLALYADFVRSLEEAWTWIQEDPEVPNGRSFKAKVLASPEPPASNLTQEERDNIKRDQMDYVFDEWVHLCNNVNASEKALKIFVHQMHSRQVVTDKDELFSFTRLALDKSVDRFDQVILSGGSPTEAFQAVDALVKMIMMFAKPQEAGIKNQTGCAAFMDGILALGVLVLNYHHYTRGDHFNQRVFYRFFNNLLREVGDLFEQELISENELGRTLSKFATHFAVLRPNQYPGFMFGWTALLASRHFLPSILRVSNNAGWAPYTTLLQHLLAYLGDLLKPFEVSHVAKDMYQAVLKLLVILQHDFPDYLAANHVQLAQSLPPHATQLLNTILVASPAAFAKLVDPFTPGLKADLIPEMREIPASTYDASGQLSQIGLLDILDQALHNGPSEDAIAQITHAINTPEEASSTFGFVPVSVNRRIIDAVVLHTGDFAVERASKTDGAVFAPGAPDVKTLYMLTTEVSPEARYYLLCSMINELRYPNAQTHYFSQVILDIFGHDMSDPEETEIRQQIVRIMLERLVGFWPQPWGLMMTVIELIKNEKYLFFDMPFIKAAPEVRTAADTYVEQLITSQTGRRAVCSYPDCRSLGQ